MDPIDLLIACVQKLGGRNIVAADGVQVDFELDEIPAFAYVQEGGRLRGSVFITLHEPVSLAEAEEWAKAQPRTAACRLDVLQNPADREGEGVIRILFERALDPFGIAVDDPLLGEASALFDAWWGRDIDPHASVKPEGSFRGVDPCGRKPTNAWLLMGDDDSYFTPDDVSQARADAAQGIYETGWTAAKQTEPGDLLFYYFMAPLKAIHFVARAADNAYFEDIGDLEAKYRGRQWWVHTSPPVAIEPVPLQHLQEVIGKIVMKGRSGRYLRPEHVEDLTRRIRPLREEDGPELARVLQPVVGSAERPDPRTLDLATWRQLAAGSFALEAQVEQYIVEPLLRWAVAAAVNVVTRKAYPIGRRIADYAVIDGDDALAVVEVKLRIRKSRNGLWQDCKDFIQVTDYARSLRCPAILIDAISVHLIPLGADRPSWSVARRDFTQGDIEAVQAFLQR